MCAAVFVMICYRVGFREGNDVCCSQPYDFLQGLWEVNVDVCCIQRYGLLQVKGECVNL